MDVRTIEAAVLEPNVPRAVATGLALEIPPGYEVQIRPRSGLALKHALTLPNSPATIDPGYRGELKVILLNLGKLPIKSMRATASPRWWWPSMKRWSGSGRVGRERPGRRRLWFFGTLGLAGLVVFGG